MLTAYGASPVLTSWNGSHDCVHFTRAMNPASDWWVAEKREYRDPRLEDWGGQPADEISPRDGSPL